MGRAGYGILVEAETETVQVLHQAPASGPEAERGVGHGISSAVQLEAQAGRPCPESDSEEMPGGGPGFGMFRWGGVAGLPSF